MSLIVKASNTTDFSFDGKKPEKDGLSFPYFIDKVPFCPSMNHKTFQTTFNNDIQTTSWRGGGAKFVVLMD